MAVERLANSKVGEAIALEEFRNMPINEAKQLGAMALFGEKYGEEVRVIKYGNSIELCGGTHVANTGNIGMIKIISEGSIAAGIRRIEAISGEAVEDAIADVQNTIKKIGSLLNSNNVIQAVEKTIAENAELHKEAENMFNERVRTLTDKLLSEATTLANGNTLVTLNGPRIPELVKNVAFAIREKSPKNTIFVAATASNENKPLLTVMITDDLVKEGLNASLTVREAAKLVQGGGGGQPQFAQAGGKNNDGLQAAFEKMIELVTK